MSPSQPLPPKESTLFKKILKCYEYKQYKNGLKFAKQILTNPKFSDHGETLAMKGLTLNCLGRKEEAYEYVKRGLRNDLKSHVCWHVFGLLQRSDHQYDKAISAYRNALKWDKDNIQILRDLSMLQIHTRDLEGYRDTRYQLFMLRPTQRVSWIGYSMAYHLLKDYDMAISILEEFRKTTAAQKPGHGPGSAKGTSSQERYENSELLLYQAMMYQEAAKYQEALDHLSRHAESEICDKLAVHELKSQLLLQLGRNKEAAKLIREHLIERNNENVTYYKWYEQALGLGSREDQKLKLYYELQNKYPRALMPFRLPLNIISEPRMFQDLIDTYLRKSLCKGQPALFRDLKSLYQRELGTPPHSFTFKKNPNSALSNNNDFFKILDNRLPFKIQIIQDLLENYHHNLKKHGSFDADEGKQCTEDPPRLLWVCYFLAQHHDYLGQFSKAMEYVDFALNHTPTLIEFHVIKAKILKHWKNIEEAVKCMEEAQSLDTADRYLNSKCAKYLLRADKLAEAEVMCSKFTREGVAASENLNEMQCMWFQTESALAYQRLGKWGDALKKCHEVDRHFAEITEDQFDFHTYCMRKMTLRAYVGLLRLEDVVKNHHFYFTAAKIAIEVYLQLSDHPLGKNDLISGVDTSNMTPAEIRKIMNKQKKENLKKQQNQSEQQSKQHHNNANSNDKNNPDAPNPEHVQEALDPLKLERPEKALDEAARFLAPLQLLARDRIETHLLSFEISIRKKKSMLMLQSLKRASRIDSENGKFRIQLQQFYDFVNDQKEQLSSPLQLVLNSEVSKLTEGSKHSLT